MKFTQGQQIKAGNHIVSIGSQSINDVAIVSMSSGSFCKIKNAGKKLKKVKREFKINLNSEDTFTFSFMQPDKTERLINILKN